MSGAAARPPGGTAAADGGRPGPVAPSEGPAVLPAVGLAGCAEPLARAYDVALVDLDGVVYVGADAVPHAVASLAAARDLGQGAAYVTNNALRTPAAVAAHLRRLGARAEASDVVTSAQAAARLLAERLPAGSRVLVAGGEGLRVALAERGLVAVGGAEDGAVAVVTGHDPEQTWARLAEAALALGRGLPWVASNTDVSVPSPRGRLPGAGAVVALLSAATGRDPDDVAGKPHPALHRESVERTGARRPLVVGDRLDTDIAGAHAGGAASLLVLTGVTEAEDLLDLPPELRPTYLAADLRGLLTAQPAPRVQGATTIVGGATARRTQEGLLVEGADALDRLRAAATACWALRDAGSPRCPVSGV